MIRQFAIILLIVFVSLASSPAAACPACKENLSNGQTNGQGEATPNLAQGFAWSIYLMIAVPFALAGGLGFAAWKLNKQAKLASQIIARQA